LYFYSKVGTCIHIEPISDINLANSGCQFLIMKHNITNSLVSAFRYDTVGRFSRKFRVSNGNLNLREMQDFEYDS